MFYVLFLIFYSHLIYHCVSPQTLRASHLLIYPHYHYEYVPTTNTPRLDDLMFQVWVTSGYSGFGQSERDLLLDRQQPFGVTCGFQMQGTLVVSKWIYGEEVVYPAGTWPHTRMWSGQPRPGISTGNEGKYADVSSFLVQIWVATGGECVAYTGDLDHEGLVGVYWL